MRPRPRERSLRLRLCGLAPERAERRVSRKRVGDPPWSAVPGRRPGEALLSARGGAIYLKFCMLCLSIVRSHRARVVERPLLHARPGGVGLGRRGARGDDAWTRTLRMQRHLHVTRGDSRPSHGMTHFSAASFRSPQRSQTDRQTDTTRHSERRGHVFIFESYTYRPTATFAPESKADLLHERRMRERKQGDSNSCPGSSCGKAGRQDCAPVLSLSCTPGRLARLSELTSTFAAGWYAG